MVDSDPALFRKADATQTAFVAGLIVGEGSFTGDAVRPHCAVKMTARHEHLLRLVHSWYPLSRFYGPYAMPGNRMDQFMVLWRGQALIQLIKDLEAFQLQDYCPHVYGRMMVVKARLAEE
jgi:hypothetical protein